jgi:cytoskeletal protein RodZ
VVPVVIALLVLVGIVGAAQGWFSGDGTTTANSSPSVPSSQQTSDPGSSARTSPSAAASDSSTPSASPSSSDDPSSPSPQSDAAGGKVLTDCRASVRAADRTVAAAEVGLKHWSEHVQAQTDANVGKITATKMDGVFKRTRLAGPDDQKRYHDAVKAADNLSGSCQAPAGASASVKQKLSDCAARSKAQQPLLKAAKDGMDDWKSHLAAMQRSRMGHVHDAQGVWIRAWRAAPPHIKAFKKLDQSFDAPSC